MGLDGVGDVVAGAEGERWAEGGGCTCDTQHEFGTLELLYLETERVPPTLREGVTVLYSLVECVSGVWTRQRVQAADSRRARYLSAWRARTAGGKRTPQLTPGTLPSRLERQVFCAVHDSVLTAFPFFVHLQRGPVTGVTFFSEVRARVVVARYFLT